MRTWIMLLMLGLTALAGCADTSQTLDDADDGSEGGDGTGSDGNSTNAPPTAKLSADVRNGTAPLSVNFTVDGSDADGDNLTWELSSNGTVIGEGSSLAAEAAHTFEEVGEHAVRLSVSDGVNTTSAAVTITVTEPEAPDEDEDESDPDAPQDRGWYTYDPVTGMCDVHEYDDVGGAVYVSELSGGTWMLAETNGEPGLQVEDNHPSSGEGAGFELDVPDCVDGDLVVV